MDQIKKKVSIRIESKSPDQEIIQQVDGEMMRKGSSVYLLYEEPDPEMGSTRAIVKLAEGQIRVNRYGDVEAEQIFDLNEDTFGHFHTKFGLFSTRITTKQIDVALSGNSLTAEWLYELHLGDAYMGQFQLKLVIQEVQA